MAKCREATGGSLPGLGDAWWSVVAGRVACPTEPKREGSPGLGLAKGGVQALASGALGTGDSLGVQGRGWREVHISGHQEPLPKVHAPPPQICDRSVTQHRGGGQCKERWKNAFGKQHLDPHLLPASRQPGQKPRTLRAPSAHPQSQRPLD